MPKLSIADAVVLSDEELETRTAAAADRVNGRIQRAQDAGRDLLPREAELTEEDRGELAVLSEALEVRAAQRRSEERGAELMREIGKLTDPAGGPRRTAQPFMPSLIVSDRTLEGHVSALREGRSFGAVETRARVTAAADLGSAGAWDAGAPNEPRHLITFAGVPTSELTGRTAQVPAYTGPTAAAGVDESTAHGEYDSVAPVDLVGLRYGRWSDVSALANVVDDLRGVAAMHSWGIARDLDLLAVDAVETAAGTPAALVDLEQQVREAVLTVAAATYSGEDALVIVGTPADLAALTATSPGNAADLASVPVRFCGARLYPSTAATAGQLTVFAPKAFRVFQTRLQSATQVSPKDGSFSFGSWIHSTPLAQQIVGAAAAVSTTAA